MPTLALLQIACLMPQNRKNSKDSHLADDQLALYIAPQDQVPLRKHTNEKFHAWTWSHKYHFYLFPLSFFSLSSLFSNATAQQRSTYQWGLTAETVFQLHSINRLTAMAPNLSKGPKVSFLPLQPSQRCVAHSWGEDSIPLSHPRLVNIHHANQILSHVVA